MTVLAQGINSATIKHTYTDVYKYDRIHAILSRCINMVKRTKAEAEETRKNIILAATEVFCEKGVAGATLLEIAERANVTRGAIYWHFKNKTDIFQALHDQLHQSAIEIILSDLENEHPDPLKQLEAVCTKLLLDLETDVFKRKTLAIFFLRCDYTGDMEVFLELQRKSRRAQLELFDRYFNRAIQTGHLDPNTDVKTLTLSLMFFLTGIVFETLRIPDLTDLKITGPKLMAQFFRSFPHHD